MVKITGNFGKVKSWINRLIRVKATGNTFVGLDTGLLTTGDNNNFMGYQAGYSNVGGYSNNFMGSLVGHSNVGGYYNNFIGTQAGHSNVGGYSNNFMGSLAGYSNLGGNYSNFMGYAAGYSNVSGNYNNFIGGRAGYSNTAGHSNVFVGYMAGYSNVNGYSNNFMGYGAGYSNVSGVNNSFIGNKAGYYETGSNTLFIDNTERANEADARIKALIYGIFDAATANQRLRVNGILELTEIKNGSTQANAGAAANEVWKTNGHASLPDNVLMIGV